MHPGRRVVAAAQAVVAQRRPRPGDCRRDVNRRAGAGVVPCERVNRRAAGQGALRWQLFKHHVTRKKDAMKPRVSEPPGAVMRLWTITRVRAGEGVDLANGWDVGRAMGLTLLPPVEVPVPSPMWNSANPRPAGSFTTAGLWAQVGTATSARL